MHRFDDSPRGTEISRHANANGKRKLEGRTQRRQRKLQGANGARRILFVRLAIRERGRIQSGRTTRGRFGGRGQFGLGPRLELFGRALVVRRLLLPETEPGQVRTPSWRRATATRAARAGVRARSLSMKRLGMAYVTRVAIDSAGVRPSPDLRSGQSRPGGER